VASQDRVAALMHAIGAVWRPQWTSGLLGIVGAGQQESVVIPYGNCTAR